MNFATFLRLLRVPNLPTVWADVICGFFIVAGASWSNGGAIEALAPLILAGSLLYCGGMANNDAQHARKDRILGKPRPIPQDQVGRRTVWFLSMLLFGGGIAAAGVAGFKSGAEAAGAPLVLGGLAAFIAVASIIYNRLARGEVSEKGYRPPSSAANATGLILLPLCRLADVAMGMVLGFYITTGQAFVVGSIPIVALATVFIYFAVLTGVSLFEDKGGGVGKLRLLRYLSLPAVWAGPVLLYLLRAGEPRPPEPLTSVLPAVVLLVALTILIQVRFARAIRDPKPRTVGMVVKWSIIGWCWLAAALLFLSQEANLVPALMVAGLFFVCFALSRVGYST